MSATCSIFYSKVIQKTLSDCIYNEGTRKQMKQRAANARNPATSDVLSEQRTFDQP